eukprot:CAMPEP_0204352954 /NCGR_PEP_ID=MMETSP0469-20131031/32292_1 /ASSEMBLY_ACC=CAM_ASM_000384 /TAXON_ID=2969 /ORGANISM="Oxyrrhis marina" /LENGTH=260 /DNA_ID=CAMNT_0051339787 /DNA_START=46 /DNA_END=828 /DNA_ORIENTATION=-
MAEAPPPPPPVPEPALDGEAMAARKTIWDQVFKETPGRISKQLSVDERTETQKLDDPNLIYGEVDFDVVVQILNIIRSDYGPLFPGGTFIDVGSGVGKAVVAASLAHPFTKCVGFEVLEKLSTKAGEILTKFTGEVRDAMDAAIPRPEVLLNKGDAVGEGGMASLVSEEQTIIFAVSTCYDDKFMKAIVEQSAGFPPDSFLITFTKQCPDLKTWKTLMAVPIVCPWSDGEGVTVFIHKKNPAAEASVPYPDEVVQAPPAP